MEDVSVYGAQASLGPVPLGGQRASAQISKVDNGYLVSFHEPGRRASEEELAEYHRKREKEVEASEITDGEIDAMIEGIIAFQRGLMDQSAAEDWKNDDDEVRRKMRDGFRVLFLGKRTGGKKRRRVTQMPIGQRPRQEERVFESLEELMKYLKRNL